MKYSNMKSTCRLSVGHFEQQIAARAESAAKPKIFKTTSHGTTVHSSFQLIYAA